MLSFAETIIAIHADFYNSNDYVYQVDLGSLGLCNKKLYYNYEPYGGNFDEFEDLQTSIKINLHSNVFFGLYDDPGDLYGSL